jgi:hypothetical protein
MESRREGEEKEGWGDGGGVVEVGKCGGEGDVVGAGLMRVEEERRRAARRSVTVAA